jgi:hypothetical protein
MSDGYALTKQQIACLEELADDFELVSADDGAPIVRGPRGELSRVGASGRLVALVEGARSYLDVNG